MHRSPAWIIALALSLAAGVPSAASVMPRPSTPYFRFHDNVWINLHHFLHVLGRAKNREADSTRRAVAGAPADSDGAALSADERGAWNDAITAYAASWSKQNPVFDKPLVAISNALARTGPEATTLAGVSVPDDLRAVLERVAPIYRRAWRPAHAQANARALASLQQQLAAHGAGIAARIARAYGQPWFSTPVPVQLSAWVTWAGAYSTDGTLIVVSTLDSGLEGAAGLETLFHEAMHQWDDTTFERVRAVAKKANVARIPADVTHAMIFYTAGDATAQEIHGYTPYADANGIWSRGLATFKKPLDSHWRRYLRGEISFDDAVAALLGGTFPTVRLIAS